MKLTLFSICLFYLTFPILANSQENVMESSTPPNFLTQKDSLYMRVNDSGQKIIEHPVKAKQTLFGIARYYSLGLDELYVHNPTLETSTALKVGQKIKIPIPNLAIRRYKNKGFLASKNAPIYYVVQDGETLYQICKTHFGMPVDSIIKRNNLKTNSIKPGQLILMGWMGTEGVPLKWRKGKPSATTKDLRTGFEKDKSKHKEISASGVCFWQKDSNEKGDLYALHREAVIGTSIAVTNPMTKKTVFAKVIGRIPDGYDRNTEIVLSPAAAREIGAKDPKFFVKTRYLK
jgi:LysM repeat protein